MSVVPEASPLRSPGRAAALLAFNAGFIDTVGFVGLFGLFTAHVTGNFVLIGASIVTHSSGIVAKLLALPTFILAVAVTSLLLRRGRNNRRLAIGYLLFFQVVLLMAFMAVGVLGGPFKGGDQPIAVACGLVGVVAMGLQNVGSRTLFSQLSPTTVMTGNVTQIVIDLVALTDRAQPDPAARARIGKMFPPVLAFALGAIAGGLGFVYLGFWCVLIGVAAVLATLFSLVPLQLAKSGQAARHG
jgi:uncharacterized membrane protein YoaK (UPF0700 family)